MTVKDKKLKKFRVLQGTHVHRTTYWRKEDVPPGVEAQPYADGVGFWSEVTYTGPVVRNGIEVKSGDIIETTDDLLERNGKPPCAPKFQRLYDEQIAEQRQLSPTVEDNLNELSEPALRKIAEDDEVDLAGCKTKPQIVKALRESRKLVGQP